jgi:alkylation response protein AidB-like acyl-CoA dehydrogenase
MDRTHVYRQQRYQSDTPAQEPPMDFRLPAEITAKLAELDAFIDAKVKPLESEHMQFFDHRREYARTDWENDGRPSAEWRALISEMERRADKAGHLHLGLPKSCGGQAASNLMIAAIREHLAPRAWGCTTTCRTNRRSSATSRSCRLSRTTARRNRSNTSRASSAAGCTCRSA